MANSDVCWHRLEKQIIQFPECNFERKQHDGAKALYKTARRHTKHETIRSESETTVKLVSWLVGHTQAEMPFKRRNLNRRGLQLQASCCEYCLLEKQASTEVSVYVSLCRDGESPDRTAQVSTYGWEVDSQCHWPTTHSPPGGTLKHTIKCTRSNLHSPPCKFGWPSNAFEAWATSCQSVSARWGLIRGGEANGRTQKCNFQEVVIRFKNGLIYYRRYCCSYFTKCE